MLKTYFITPHPLLRAFVDVYIRSTSGGHIVTFGGNWPASNESTLIFYRGDLPGHYDSPHPDCVLSGKENCLVGLLTGTNGRMKFEGRADTFMIQFKANGINKIFGMPANQIANRILTAQDVFGNGIRDLQDQLRESDANDEMAGYADKFLLAHLEHKRKSHVLYDGITAVSSELAKLSRMSLGVEQCADKINMSVRNFERRFLEQVGVPAKQYLKLLRFNEVMKIRLMKPGRNWTAIAHECGYFDQMHLIKDFKQFTGFTPTDYFRRNDQLIRPYVDTTSVNQPDPRHRNQPPPNEHFVFIRRTSF